MEKYHAEILYKLEEAIGELEIEADCSLHRIETVIHLILECLSEVKKYVLKKGFKNIGEEIHFYKYHKPVIVSKLFTIMPFIKSKQKSLMVQNLLRNT